MKEIEFDRFSLMERRKQRENDAQKGPGAPRRRTDVAGRLHGSVGSATRLEVRGIDRGKRVFAAVSVEVIVPIGNDQAR